MIYIVIKMFNPNDEIRARMDFYENRNAISFVFIIEAQKNDCIDNSLIRVTICFRIDRI